MPRSSQHGRLDTSSRTESVRSRSATGEGVPCSHAPCPAWDPNPRSQVEGILIPAGLLKRTAASRHLTQRCGFVTEARTRTVGSAANAHPDIPPFGRGRAGDGAIGHRRGRFVQDLEYGGWRFGPDRGEVYEQTTPERPRHRTKIVSGEAARYDAAVSHSVEHGRPRSSLTVWQRIVEVWSLLSLAVLFVLAAAGSYSGTGSKASTGFSLACAAILLFRAWHRDHTRSE